MSHPTMPPVSTPAEATIVPDTNTQQNQADVSLSAASVDSFIQKEDENDNLMDEIDNLMEENDNFMDANFCADRPHVVDRSDNEGDKGEIDEATSAVTATEPASEHASANSETTTTLALQQVTDPASSVTTALASAKLADVWLPAGR
jgi:hypothetical protein